MKRVFILVARGWQIGPSRILPPSCRYTPSCSQYAIDALESTARSRVDGWQRSVYCAATLGVGTGSTRYRKPGGIEI